MRAIQEMSSSELEVEANRWFLEGAVPSVTERYADILVEIERRRRDPRANAPVNARSGIAGPNVPGAGEEPTEDGRGVGARARLAPPLAGVDEDTVREVACACMLVWACASDEARGRMAAAIEAGRGPTEVLREWVEIGARAEEPGS